MFLHPGALQGVLAGNSPYILKGLCHEQKLYAQGRSA